MENVISLKSTDPLLKEDLHEEGLPESLKGRVALITGSSQGLGRAFAFRLASEGCKVVINHLGGSEAAHQVVDEIKDLGGEAMELEADVADEKVVADLFDTIRGQYGPVEILINNARIDPWKRAPETTEGQWWDQVMAVNLKGAYLCSWKFMEQIGDGDWGRIVNISSVRSFLPAEPNMIAYGVSKLGMHGLTRAFADWGAPHGITANTVAPGVVHTENIHHRLTPKKYASEIARVPVGCAATMNEIANAVLFILQNRHLTGQTININGGMHYSA